MSERLRDWQKKGLSVVHCDAVGVTRVLAHDGRMRRRDLIKEDWIEDKSHVPSSGNPTIYPLPPSYSNHGGTIRSRTALQVRESHRSGKLGSLDGRYSAVSPDRRILLIYTYSLPCQNSSSAQVAPTTKEEIQRRTSSKGALDEWSRFRSILDGLLSPQNRRQSRKLHR